jgi:hypothetical protein
MQPQIFSLEDNFVGSFILQKNATGMNKTKAGSLNDAIKNN